MWTYTKAEGAMFAASPGSVAARLTAAIAEARQRFAAWETTALGRAEVSRPGDRDLQDIGISRANAAAEARKPFWRE
jgi:uncharacterized protein YjiS (DUF1127 family)